MSLLTLIQSATARLNLPLPNAAATSSDNQVMNLIALANEEGQELSERHRWNALINEATFNTVAAESQGLITTLAPGYKYLFAESLWDRNLNRPIVAITPEEWQQQKANHVSGPYYRYRLRGNNLLFYPAPTAGLAVAFEYISKNWLTDSTGATGRAAWANDADIGLLDENLMLSGLIWRWKQSKGLEYAEDYAKYERRVADAISRDLPARRINMNGNAFTGGPQPISPFSVTEGSWTI